MNELHLSAALFAYRICQVINDYGPIGPGGTDQCGHSAFLVGRSQVFVNPTTAPAILIGQIMRDLDGPLRVRFIGLPSCGQGFIWGLGLNVDKRDPGASLGRGKDCRWALDANRPILWRDEGIAENGGLRSIGSETLGRLLGRGIRGSLVRALVLSQKQNATEQQEKTDEEVFHGLD